MNGIGEITRIYIGDNDDESAQIRRLIMRIGFEDNARDVEHIEPAGEDSGPVVGDQAIVLQIADNYQIAILIDDGITPTARPGEKIIYAHTHGQRQAFIKLKTDGEIWLGNNTVQQPTDFAVLYNKQKIELDELKAKFNSLVSAFNSHNHPPIALNPPSVQSNASNADFANGKCNYIRIDEE